MIIVYSLLKGFCLGSFFSILSDYIDITFCKESYKKIIQTNKSNYLKSITSVKRNLLITGPVIYSVVNVTLLTPGFEIQLGKIFGILGIHSIGYYLAHYAMHKNKYLYNFHKFHHEFDYILLPSIGNAVSTQEFLLAYMSPFVIGAFVFNPSEISFVIPISIIAFLNLAIHCQELENTGWLKIFVSPNDHIKHHKIRNKHFAAPTINIDYLLESVGIE